MADRAERRGVDVHGHRALEVIDSVDPVAGERERVAGREPRHPPTALDLEVLARDLSGDHVDAPTRAAMVVEAAVARLPPRVEPGFRAVGAPERGGTARAAAVESVDVDQLCRPARDRGAGVGPEDTDSAN